MEYFGEGVVYRWYYLDLVCGVFFLCFLFVFYVFYEWFGGCVVVCDGYVYLLKKKIINDVKRRWIYVKIVMYKDGWYE